MSLTAEEIVAAVREHVSAESMFDLERLRATLVEDVRYEIMAPRYPDDPTPYGIFTGADTYLDMWRNLRDTFSSYEIDIEEVVPSPESNQALVIINATATPRRDWRDLKAGMPMRWWAAAVIRFNQSGEMLSETVYGSLPPTMAGLDRMMEFAAIARTEE
ncbi:MAG TPA: nuclear transport factor 2 family protein [Acidimicrobiia bacterium]|nr:nuclear transport factor 2 family protein [Acidimicrobiia bacterium]